MARSALAAVPMGLFRGLTGILRWLGRRLHGFYAAFGLFLVIALGLATVALWVLVEMAELIVRGATARFDERVLLWMNGHATPTRDKIALQITSIGDGAVVVAITLLLCLFLWVLRYRLAVILLIVGVAGADIGNWVLKAAFERPRPELFVLETPFARPMSASFPSGHATAAMALYLLVAYLLSRLGGRGWFRVLSIGLATVLVVTIGASRMYLGVHYPSDVIAGYLSGFIWVVFCILGFEAVEVARGRRRPAEDRNLPHPPAYEQAASREA